MSSRVGSVGRWSVVVTVAVLLACGNRAEEGAGPAEPKGGGAEPGNVAKLEAALERTFVCDFPESTLGDFLEFLRDYSGVNVVADEGKLRDQGIELETPISLAVKNISVGSALNLLLDPLGLVAVISDEVLLITDRESADARLELEVHPVGDLVLVKGEEKYSVHGDHLAELIRKTLGPKSWEEGGGSGSIVFEPLTLSLVVHQARSRQQEVKKLLAQLRQAKSGVVTETRQGEMPALAVLEGAVDRHLSQAAKRRERRSAGRGSNGGGGSEVDNSPIARKARAEARLAEADAELAELRLEQAKNATPVATPAKTNPGAPSDHAQASATAAP